MKPKFDPECSSIDVKDLENSEILKTERRLAEWFRKNLKELSSEANKESPNCGEKL